MARGLANKARTIRMPVHIVERRQHLDRAERMPSVELGREPTLQEVTERAGLSLQQALAVEAAARASTSLDQPLVAEEDALVGDMIAGDGPLPEERVNSTFRYEALEEAPAPLGERERTVIVLRFGLRGMELKTLEEIGRRLGFSRERAAPTRDEGAQAACSAAGDGAAGRTARGVRAGQGVRGGTGVFVTTMDLCRC